LPERYIIKDKINTPLGTQVLASLKKVYAQYPQELTDGIKIFQDSSWALVRTSGTEPIIRIIVDSDTPKTAEIFHQELTGTISKIITSHKP